MGLLQRLREHYHVKRAVTAELARLPHLEDNAIPLSPVLPGEGTSTQMGEVTGAYRVVSALMSEMVAEKQKGRKAAQRISNSVGVVPVATKR